MGWLTRKELVSLGFASLGDDVQVSDRCCLHGTRYMHIADHVRIDDMAVITAGEEVIIGSHVHIGAQVFIGGRYGVTLGDFVNVSPGVAIFSGSDDFSGHALVGPLVPARLRRVQTGRVTLCRHVVVGARSVVLPGVTLREGAAVGALSLVKRSLEGWTVYAGVPVRPIRSRSKAVLDLQRDMLAAQPAARAAG